MRPEMLASLYRFRPLSDAVVDPSIGLTLLDRELSALTESYLYAPSFSDMNDPMEAFYEFDGSLDCGFQKVGTVVPLIPGQPFR